MPTLCRGGGVPATCVALTVQARGRSGGVLSSLSSRPVCALHLLVHYLYRARVESMSRVGVRGGREGACRVLGQSSYSVPFSPGCCA